MDPSAPFDNDDGLDPIPSDEMPSSPSDLLEPPTPTPQRPRGGGENAVENQKMFKFCNFLQFAINIETDEIKIFDKFETFFRFFSMKFEL